MRTINIHQVDAFTDRIFGGNPAGVVTNADELTKDEMKKIAREMNLSETAFVLTPSADEADVKLRFFTPAGDEIKFCGHATVGALFQLAKLELFGLGEMGVNDVHVETGAGVLLMKVTNEEGLPPTVTFTAPETNLHPYRLQAAEFAKEFGVPVELIDAVSTVYLDKNLNYLYIPTTSLKALDGQVFDFARIRQNFSEEAVVVFCFYVNRVMEAGSDLHARGLAPNVGIDEDPFTGSMQAGLVLSAKRNSYIDADKQKIVVEQGYCLSRPGSATVEHDLTSGVISVTANATRVFSAEMGL